MKVSKEQARHNRERVLDTAARLFRERGFHGVGVAELMQHAGLTHGAFYGQFASKEALLAECARHSIDGAAMRWARVGAAHPEDPLGAITAAYLSEEHRDHPGEGCPLVAMGPELARQGEAVRSAATAAIKLQLQRLAPLMHGDNEGEKMQGAMVTIASMVGALLLARIVNEAELSDALLGAVHDAISGGDVPD